MANKEIGHTGLETFAGQIQEEFLTELRGSKAYRAYREMELNSPVVGAFLYAIDKAVQQAEWNFKSDIEDDPRVELLNDARDNMTHGWKTHIQQAMSMLVHGYALSEIVYENVGGRVLWRKFGERGQDTVYAWDFDEQGGILGFEQQVSISFLRSGVGNVFKPVFIPMEKLLLYRTTIRRNNPEGQSILRTSYIPYYYSKHMQHIEAIGMERDLAGLPVMSLPKGADTAESDSGSTDVGRAKEIVRNVRNDEQAGVVLPDGWKLDLLSTGGSRQFDTDAIISRYEKRILMATLSQFLMLGMDNVGSLALSRDQSDFFNMSINHFADVIAETITRHAIPRLMRLNGLDAKGLALEHTPVGEFDMGTMSTMLSQLSTGNFITWTAEDESWLRQAAGLPERTPEELEEAREKKREQAMQTAVAIGGGNQTEEDDE